MNQRMNLITGVRYMMVVIPFILTGVLLSRYLLVHFVRPTEKKCFYFVTKDVGKLYPKQDPGDVIAFPSWTPTWC